MARRQPRQLALPRTGGWGGARRGAGRKRTLGPRSLRRTPHRALPVQRAAYPVHVTVRSAFRPLRRQHVLPTLWRAIAGATQRAPAEFRIVHFSVQFDHLHLIVEAADARALSSGVRSLVIRIARSVNALVGRAGSFWADRWFGRELSSPRQVRNALLYVLANARKHARRPLPPGVDPFSSGAWFDGWRRASAGAGAGRRNEPDTPANPRVRARNASSQGPPVVLPRTWLARVGWRRHGLLGLDEAPAHP